MEDLNCDILDEYHKPSEYRLLIEPPIGFEPTCSRRNPDYKSGAIDQLCEGGKKSTVAGGGIEPPYLAGYEPESEPARSPQCFLNISINY